MSRGFIIAIFVVLAPIAWMVGTCAGEAGNNQPHKGTPDVVSEVQQPAVQTDVMVAPAVEVTTVTININQESPPCEEMEKLLPHQGIVLDAKNRSKVVLKPHWPPPESALVDPALVRLGVLEGEADARRVNKEMAERARAYKAREDARKNLPFAY